MVRRILLLSLLPLIATAQELPEREAAVLRCAHEVFGAVGEEVWPGWSGAPFPILLIAGEHEFLTGAKPEPAGFVRTDDRNVLRRKRTFDPGLLATFPAFSAEPVIIIGTPEATKKSDAAWLITVLHEHFHQLQYSQPWYYEKTAALNLAKGDTSGTWMLNYDFPYADAAVQQRYERFTRALAAALAQRNYDSLREVKTAWRELRENLRPDDYAYLRFQLWQEGVARYVELMSAERAARVPCLEKITPPMPEVAKGARERIMKTLESPRLNELKRVAFYAAGAAVAMLLNETSPAWKTKYMEEPFAMEAYFSP